MANEGWTAAQLRVVRVDYDPFVPFAPVEIPATRAQSESWLSTEATARADATHKEALWLELTGQVDDSALRLAFQSLVDSHEALRAHFSDDGTRLIVEPHIAITAKEVDVSTDHGDPLADAIGRIVEADAARPFDLAAGPLFRATLVRPAVDRRFILLTAHQAVCDGWSMDVILRDLGRLYSAFVGVHPLPSPPSHGYSDYARWWTTASVQRRIDASATYWRSHAHGDGHAPGCAGPAAVAELRIAPEVLGSVRALASQQRLSSFSVLLSAYGLLLERTRGAGELRVAIPVAGHPEAGMEDSVGPLAKVVPVTLPTGLGQDFAERCRRAYGAVVDAKEHAWLDLCDIAALSAAGAAAATTVAPVAFSHTQKYGPGKLVFAGCQVDYRIPAPAFEQFELNLVAFEGHDDLVVQLRAPRELHDAPALAEMLRSYEALLKRACAVADSTRETGAGPSGSAPPSQQTSPDPTPMVVTLREGSPDKVPLFFLFGIQLYVDVANAMTDGAPVIAMHIPMLYRPAFDERPSLGKVAARYVEAIRGVRPHGPYRLGGLCFGGIVAYEAARILTGQGEEVTMVALLDSALPRGRRTDRKAWAKHVLGRSLADPKEAARQAGKQLVATCASSLAKVPFGKKTLAGFITATTGDDPTAVVDLPVLGREAIADVEALDVSNPYLDAPVIVFRATRRDTPPWQTVDPAMGWTGRAKSVKAVEIASDHLDIVRPPHAAEVAAVLMTIPNGPQPQTGNR